VTSRRQLAATFGPAYAERQQAVRVRKWEHEHLRRRGRAYMRPVLRRRRRRAAVPRAVPTFAAVQPFAERIQRGLFQMRENIRALAAGWMVAPGFRRAVEAAAADAQFRRAATVRAGMTPSYAIVDELHD